MGDVISLMERRAQRRASTPPPSARGPVTLFFDLASPYTYLAAERVDRLFTDVHWVPVIADALHATTTVADSEELAATQLAAERRAAVLRMPLVWPDRTTAPARAAMRVAAHAAQRQRGAAFVLAASRLAFCGGFDVDDPDILAEASAAASLSLGACLRAAGDRRLDGPMEAAGRRLLAQGADRIPILKVGRTLFCGEHRLSEAAAAARGQTSLQQAGRHAPPGAVRHGFTSI
ncbi:MAG: 2-hydroxychromene-2-carboxylate isomerase-like protein [Solirubrobacterales bacterium]|nr:2-hydroxychromene-2-carboxylate isomerase-like protein [Solirubrobacterales bacterium]